MGFMKNTAASNTANHAGNQQTNGRNGRGQQFSEDFVEAEFWANVGYWDEIDGEAIFISLGKGIPLDQMKEVRGNSPLSQLKRQLNHLAMESARTLEPGEATDVAELVVQFRRVAPAETPAAGSGIGNLSRLTFTKRT